MTEVEVAEMWTKPRFGGQSVGVVFFAMLVLLPPARGWQDSDEGSRIYGSASKSVFLILAKSLDGKVVSQGTGFLIAGNKIVTNDHMVSTDTVVLDLGAAKLPLTVGLRDSVNDVAVLTPVGELSADPLAFAKTLPATGTRIYAIGNPQGLERTISAGLVSGVRDLKGRSQLPIRQLAASARRIGDTCQLRSGYC